MREELSLFAAYPEATWCRTIDLNVLRSLCEIVVPEDTPAEDRLLGWFVLMGCDSGLEWMRARAAFLFNYEAFCANACIE